ncbi:Uncharacterised protein [Vibrio cholerae]|nr:hypothetical protein DN38_3232 [Vibrio cholerae]CSB88540.1 Uncharacterised protein [Vibrio cholerae]
MLVLAQNTITCEASKILRSLNEKPPCVALAMRVLPSSLPAKIKCQGCEFTLEALMRTNSLRSATCCSDSLRLASNALVE